MINKRRRLQSKSGRLKRGVKYRGGAQEHLASGRVPYELEPTADPKPPRLKKRRAVFGGTRNGKPATIVKNKVGRNYGKR